MNGNAGVQAAMVAQDDAGGAAVARRRAVLFDVDGVLVHGFHPVTERRRRWDEHLRNDLGIEPEAFVRDFIRGPFENLVLPGKLALVDALAQVLPSLGFDGSPLRVVDYWLNRDSRLNYRLLDLVHRLRRAGVAPLHVASNQEHVRAFHLWNTLGLKSYFDDMFYSARVGALKPERAFFERVAHMLGPQALPPLLFDDKPDVVDAARRFGWDAVLYRDLDDCLRNDWVAAALGD